MKMKYPTLGQDIENIAREMQFVYLVLYYWRCLTCCYTYETPSPSYISLFFHTGYAVLWYVLKFC